MEEFEKAKKLVDQNRLVVAISISWVVLANLFYFSLIDKSSCSGITAFEGNDAPYWMIIWHSLTLGYLPLYEIVRELRLGSVICSQLKFDVVGYFSFALLPVMVLVLLIVTVKWVRGA